MWLILSKGGNKLVNSLVTLQFGKLDFGGTCKNQEEKKKITTW